MISILELNESKPEDKCIPANVLLPSAAFGQGSPTLVFLHYFGGSQREWKPAVRKLQDRRRCITVDAPGFGDAVGVDGYTVEEMAQHILKLVRSLEQERIVLVGHSMMGKVSMVAASRRPDNLIGVVLVAPSPLEPEPMTEEARTEMISGQRDRDRARAFFLNGAKSELSAEDIQQGTDDALRANPTAWRRWPQSGAREDWSFAIPSIEVPTLLVVGERDPAIPLSFQKEKTLGHLSKGELEVIPSAGHLLPYEAPDALSASIEKFVDALS